MRSETEKVLRIHHLLLAAYGDHPWHARDPVATLVSTILSQNTNDVNRDRAFDQLRDRFPTWEAVRDAPEEGLLEAIRPAGLGPTKAPRIQEVLRIISRERGQITLDFLGEMATEEARDWLTGLPGVGPKTAAIVLLFALGKPAFPVDTHVHRVSQRLGLIPQGTSREKAHQLLEEIVPPDIYYPFHLNLIEHGRAVCHARNPKHERCVLQDACEYYAALRHERNGPDHNRLRLILVRHGETVANVEGRWTGLGETELTSQGRAQVEAVAHRLGTEVRDAVAIYTSPLPRAHETARAIGRALGLKPAVVEGLREVDFGHLDGITIEEMRTHHPTIYERWKDRADGDFTWPGGDRRADFFHRVAATCDEIIARHAHGTIVVVGHGGTLRSCLSHLLPEELGAWWTYRIDNCSLTQILLEDGTVQLVALNDTAHLPEQADT
jgi:endonuclease-3